MTNGVADLIQAWLAADETRTLGVLAHRSGLSRSYLSRLGRGEREGARPDTLGPLAQGLGVPIEKVIEATGATVVKIPVGTFRDFVTADKRLSKRQRDGLLHMYYEAFGLVDSSNAGPDQ